MGTVNLGPTTTNLAEPDQLLASITFPKHEEPITVKTGSGVLKRGTPLGLETASGKAVPYNQAGADGSEDFIGLLIEDIDATSADVKTRRYMTGEFNKTYLSTFSNWHTDLIAAGEAMNLYFVNVLDPGNSVYPGA